MPSPYAQWRNWKFEPGVEKLSWRGPTGHCKGPLPNTQKKRL